MLIPLHIGESIEVESHGKHAVLKKHSRGTYFMQIKGSEHARWGNRDEIRADVEHFKRYGSLPRETQGRPW